MVSPRPCMGMRCASGTHGFYRFEGYSEIRRALGRVPGLASRGKSNRVGGFVGLNIPAHGYSY